ncbi:MAG: amidohydrolase family protein [Methanosarcinaceae archaeon]|nr:amidohydrolase family protein [Methanosarcinaceae archaeon]
MADILIKNGYILTMDSEKPEIIKNCVISIENGIINYVGPENSGPKKSGYVIDAKGCVVMPGLSNTHTHMGMTLFRGFADDMKLNDWLENKIWPAEACLKESDVKAGSDLACLEMIKSGTTACCDMYFHMDETAKSVKESGMRAALSYGMINFNDEEKGKRELDISKKFVRNWNGKENGKITAMYGPHSPVTCSIELLEKVKEQAQKDNVKIHIHVLETENELNTMKENHGMCSVHYLDKIDFWGPDILAAHCIWMSDRDIELFGKKQVNVSHVPLSNMKLASGIAEIGKMMKANVPVSIGTDGCASNNNLNLFEEIKISSLIQKIHLNDPTALPAYDSIAMATRNGGKVIDEKTGIIKPGFKADIILLDLKKPHMTPNKTEYNNVVSHIAYSVSGTDVKTVIIDGKIVMEDRIVKTLDEQKVLENAENAAYELFERKNEK